MAKPRRLFIESFEPRHLMDGSVIISEFMALNSSTLTDEDGEFSDWIELHNSGDTTVNLEGFSLTDSFNTPRKWRFPAVSLAPGGYMTVFASSKDRAVAGAALHTNFRLSGDGEYLALFEPDGVTAATEFAPYPEQLTDISYGAVATTIDTTLIAPGAPARAIVPASDALGASWTQSTFNDGAWTAGTTGIGYDTTDLYDNEIGLDLTSAMNGANASSFVRVPFNVSDPAEVDKLTLRLKYDDGFVGYLNGESVVARNAPKGGDSPDTGLVAYFPFDNHLEDRAGDFPSNSGAADNDLSAVGGSATTFAPGMVGQAVSINTSTADRDRFTTPQQNDLDLGGQFTVEAWIYPTELTGFGRLVMEWDGSGRNSIFFALRNGSQLSVFHVDSANTQRSVDSPIGTIQLGSAGGWQHVAVVGDGAFLRLYHNGVEVSAGTGGTATVPTPVAYPGTTRALNAGLGIGDSAGGPSATQTYEGYVDEVALWRVPLTAAEIASHFQAGSAGYGLAVVGGAGTIPFDSRALAERPQDEDGVDWEEIDVSDYRDRLVTGANVLAIHGLNVSATDADFLIVPELIGGRVVLDPESYGYFEESTPDAVNGDTLLSLVADIDFSHERGYYNAPLALTIATPTPDVTIRYTTDGSAPTETNGTAYTSPIAVSQTRTVRAAAFKPGFRPSEIVSHTFVFLDQVLTQTNQAPAGAHWDTQVDPNVVNNTAQTHSVREGLTSLPTLSIAMTPGDLFGANGIYQNPQNRGDTWVRPGSVEFFYPDEYTGYRVDEGFQIDAGVRIQGVFSRLTSNPKHSFRLSFQERFGPSKLEFPLYQGSPVTQFDNLIVLNGHNQSWATGVGNTLYLRDPVSRDLQELRPGDVHTNTQYVNLYLNGMYWGLFGLVERPDETFASEHFGGDKDDYDVLKGVRFGETTQAMLTNGGRDVWDAMFALADQDMANPTNYAAMQQFVDIDQLIDYNIGIIYTGDRDGPTGIVAGQSTPKNFYGVRHRSPEGRFRFYPWDADFTFEDVNADVSEREGTQNPARLHYHLRANPEYRLKFADHVRKWFFNDGPLTPGPVAEQFLLRAQEIDQAVVAESARWGDSKREPPYSRDVEWVSERNRVVNSYIPARSGVVLNQFVADGLYPAVAAPDYTVDGAPQHGGPVQSTDAIGIMAPTGTIYYTTDGSDPRTGPPTVVTTTLVADTAPVRALVPVDGSLGATWQQAGFSDAAWLSGTSGVGYDRGTGFSGLIGLDLLSPAIPAGSRIDTNGDGVNENNSVYSRYSFNVADPAEFDSLMLNMRYDDGFVAYLNGHEVARANAPATTQFNSAATLDRGDSGEVMIAIVYDSNNQMTIYRNGQVYATAANTSLGSLQTYPAGVADVLFGLRHIDIVGQAGSAAGTDAYLAGSINEARIYSAALSGSQIQQVFSAGPLVGSAAPPADANLRHLWSFNTSANDQVGTAHGTANGGATVTGGRLVLDGVNDYVRTAPINGAISTKTLIAWVSLANLTQAAGSAITLENPTGADIFDGLVFAERVSRQWMAGSNNFLRSVSNNGGAAETVIGGQAIGFEPFDLTQHRNRLVSGQNVLAIHALNSSVTDGNMLITPRLDATNVVSTGVSPNATSFATPFSVGETTIVRSRTLSPTGVWSALTEAVFTVPLDGLAVSEVMFHPAAPPPESVFLPDDFEFFELRNVGSQPINLSKVALTGGIEFDFASSSFTTLGPGQFVLVVANTSAIEERYGTGLPVAGQYTGNLANEGETITISDIFGTTIKEFTYGDGWYSHTDGEGFSLTRLDPTVPTADLSLSESWRPSNLDGGSPGSADTAVAPDAIVINELLANPTGGADGDWIELRNTTAQPIDIGHWFLSDSQFERQRYRFAADTIVPANGYLVVTENADFGPASGDPGALVPFELSRHGDSIYLTGGDALGRELGYRDDQTFEATEPGVTLGVYIKSTDGSDFVRLAQPTRGAANAPPIVGPLVINEIMYNPAGIAPEFIELHNPTAVAVPLHDAVGHPWRLRGAVDYEFPFGASIPAGGYALLVQGADHGDPLAEAAAFRTARGVPASVGIFIYTDEDHGSLSNGGEKIYLDQPGDPNSGLPETPYLLIDAVNYDDDPPWTTLADGGGPSLSRFSPSAYGNDVINWGAGSNGGTPGTLNVTLDTTPPSIPQNISGRIISSGQVRLRWSAASDAQSGVDRYNIYRDNILIGSAPVEVFTDNVTFAPTPFSYQVAAVNGDGFESARAAAVAIGGTITSFQQGVAGYSGAADATIRQATPTTATGATETFLEVDGDDGAGVDKSILLRWSNLSLPAGRLLVGASITINVTDPTAGAYGVYPVLRDWVESQVTWNEAAAGASWGTAGALGPADRGATSIASASGGTGSQTINLNATGVSLVQGWLAGIGANRGLVIADPNTTDGFDFDARETGAATNRPKLTLVHIASPTPVTPGDINEDGVVSAADIDELFAAVSAGSSDVVFDVDGNAAVNLADVDRLVHEIMDAEYGDANLDGVIDRRDLAQLAANLGRETDGAWSQGDFDGNRAIDLADLARLQSHFGFTAFSPAVSPASVVARVSRSISRELVVDRILAEGEAAEDTVELTRSQHADNERPILRASRAVQAARRLARELATDSWHPGG
jgi:hypothetical protein